MIGPKCGASTNPRGQLSTPVAPVADRLNLWTNAFPFPDRLRDGEIGRQSSNRSLSVIDPEGVAGQRRALRPIYFQRRWKVEMSNTKLNDYQLLDEAKAALRGKDVERATPLFAEYSRRRVAAVKAKVANDPA